MSDVFISYSRKDSEFVQKLARALKVKKLDNWLDHEDIEPSEDWRERIQNGIEGADNFLFVISPDSLKSQECLKEIELAVQNGKRFIPLVVRDVNPDETHPEVAKVNWIFFRDGVDNFGVSFDKLIAAINTDLAWAKTHRRLQVRALEWERGEYDASFLLRGKDLKDAVFQFENIDLTKDPKPTELQRRYVVESQKDSRRRMTRNIAAVSVSLIIMVLAVLAFYQRSVAIDERDLKSTAQIQAEVAEGVAIQERDLKSTAQVVAEEERDLKATAQAVAESERQAYYGQYLDGIGEADLALLISAQAYNFSQNARTTSALYKILEQNQQLVAYLHLTPDMEMTGFPQIGISQDGTKLVFWVTLSESESHYYLWDAQSYLKLDEVSFPSDMLVYIDGMMLSTSGGQSIYWGLPDYDGSSAPYDRSEFANRYGIMSSYWMPDGKTVVSATCRAFKSMSGLCVQPGGLLYTETSDFMVPGIVSFDMGVIAMAYDQSQVLWMVRFWENNAELWRWDLANPTPALVANALPVYDFDSWSQSLAFSPDSQWMVYINTANVLQVWDVQSNSLLADQSFESLIQDVSISPDGTKIATVDENGVKLWDFTGTQLNPKIELDHTGFVVDSAMSDLKFSGDSQTLVFAQEKKILLWSVVDGSLVQEINLLPSLHTISQISVDQSGDLVAVGMSPVAAGPVPKLLLVDTPTSVEIGPLEWDVEFPALSPDGRYLVATCEYCDQLKKWEIDSDSWRDQACQIAGRNLDQTEWKQFMGDREHQMTCPRYSQ